MARMVLRYSIQVRKLDITPSALRFCSRNVLKLSERGLYEDMFPANSSKEILDLLNAKPQTVYAGFDPTADSLHVGHLLVLMGLLHWQRAGHNVIAVVGSATAQVGDPSGRVTERPELASGLVTRNATALSSNLQQIFDNHRQFLWPDQKQLGNFISQSLLEGIEGRQSGPSPTPPPPRTQRRSQASSTRRSRPARSLSTVGAVFPPLPAAAGGGAVSAPIPSTSRGGSGGGSGGGSASSDGAGVRHSPFALAPPHGSSGDAVSNPWDEFIHLSRGRRRTLSLARLEQGRRFQIVGARFDVGYGVEQVIVDFAEPCISTWLPTRFTELVHRLSIEGFVAGRPTLIYRGRDGTSDNSGHVVEISPAPRNI